MLSLTIDPFHLQLTKVKQRGLVPAMRYSSGSIDEIILESGLVSQFLADSHPSHLLPASDSSPASSLFRYQVNFFVDTYFSKVSTYMYGVIRATSEEEKQTKSDELVKAIEKEIEPLLHNVNPFFGGSKEMTLVEVWLLPVQDSRISFCTWHEHSTDFFVSLP